MIQSRHLRLMGGGRTVAWDSFTGADGSPVTLRPTDSGHQWRHHPTLSTASDDPIIDTGRVHNANDALVRCALIVRRPYRMTGRVACDVFVASDTNASIAGVVSGFLPTGFSKGIARYTSNGDAWAAFDGVTAAQIGGNFGSAIGVGQSASLEWEIRRGCVLVRVDGALLLKGSIPTPHRMQPGIRVHAAATAATGVHLDNWMVTR